MAVQKNDSLDDGVLGRGKLFIRFSGETTYSQVDGINNFSFSNDVESVVRDDFSEEVVQEVQEGNVKQSTSVSFTVNAITDNNAALFGLTKPSQIASSSQGSATDTVLSNVAAEAGKLTRLPVIGATVTDISPNGGGTALVSGTDYLVFNDMVKWGTGVTGNYDITYDTPAKTIKKTLSGETATLEAHILFKANNAQGKNRDFESFVNLKGSGEFNLVGNEYVEVSLEGKALIRESETGFNKTYQLTRSE